MTLPILNILSKDIELNTLFIQPTYWCGRNCTKCYVKERDEENQLTSVSLQEWIQFFLYVSSSSGIKVNEVTLAVDDFSGEKEMDFLMENVFISFLYSARTSLTKNHIPKFNMTFHTIKTLLDYLNIDKKAPYDKTFLASLTTKILKGLHMVSFSQLDLSDDLTKEILNHLREEAFVNYNLLIPRKMNRHKIQKQIAHLQQVAEYVDHIYLVIHKDPIGKSRTDEEIEISEENMENDLFYLNVIQNRLPPTILNKIDIDGCLKDIRKYNKTGFGCSGNISKMQVWPDGTVTGCSYADKAADNQKYALTAQDILNNIKLAKKNYDFTEIPCHLVEDYNNCLSKPKEVHLKRVTSILQEIL